MPPSLLYILKNRSYKENVLKIGMTTGTSAGRAKQIYSGATGVPEPFDVLFSCTVANCRAAETKVHQRLAAFRVNNSREFFRIPSSIARQVVLEECAKINKAYEFDSPSITVDRIATPTAETETSEQYEEKFGEVLALPIDAIEPSSLGTSTLTLKQRERIDLIAAILGEFSVNEEEGWHDSFTRDQFPEREIRIWEHIAKAYLKIEDIDYFSVDAKREAYNLIFDRSLQPTSKVLEEHVLQFFTRERALKILKGYELAPKPIVVSRRNTPTKANQTNHPKLMVAAIKKIFHAVGH